MRPPLHMIEVKITYRAVSLTASNIYSSNRLGEATSLEEELPKHGLTRRIESASDGDRR
jgi:hypothetical protein